MSEWGVPTDIQISHVFKSDPKVPQQQQQQQRQVFLDLRLRLQVKISAHFATLTYRGLIWKHLPAFIKWFEQTFENVQ